MIMNDRDFIRCVSVAEKLIFTIGGRDVTLGEILIVTWKAEVLWLCNKLLQTAPQISVRMN